MKRRKFLTIAGLGALIGAVASDKFMATTFESSTARLIKEELAFLQLDDDGVRAFTRDYAKLKRNEFKVIVKGYSFLGISSSQSGKIHHIVSTYLLSSDFFINKMDENASSNTLHFTTRTGVLAYIPSAICKWAT